MDILATVLSSNTSSSSIPQGVNINGVTVCRRIILFYDDTILYYSDSGEYIAKNIKCCIGKIDCSWKYYSRTNGFPVSSAFVFPMSVIFTAKGSVQNWADLPRTHQCQRT